MDNPNSLDNELQDAQSANLETPVEGTEQKDTVETTNQEVAPEVDYKTKFSESTKEAQRLYEENKRMREEIELKDKPQETTDNLYPGFEELDLEAQKNLIAYTNQITKRAKEELYKDPAIAYAKSSYNERVWDTAFEKVMDTYPELKDTKDEFKKKYYNVNNVPVNIGEILGDIAKIHLFDKAKEIGASEEKTKLNRIETERSTAGDRNPQTARSLEDWQRMSIENPQQFAKLGKEFNEAMASGKLKE